MAWRRSIPRVRSAQQLARQFADAGVFLDPTLVVMECLARLTDPEVTEAPGVAQMPETHPRGLGGARRRAARQLVG